MCGIGVLTFTERTIHFRKENFAIISYVLTCRLGRGWTVATGLFLVKYFADAKCEITLRTQVCCAL